ncbi:toxin [Ottowia sp. GY511]|uniref:Toxin n=1 Tax=Ottowia flava TaxID=2675430 RepID=A0ABW4KY61_9BURK|nr:toxin [Ottowia sp. GY511]TXK22045.1 toxin [Ottowia sp. GY511]
MRAIVIGTSGTGKTTFARQLAGTIGAPHTELDALYWGPGWTPRPTEQFLAAVDAASAGERWVIDGNYAAARDLLWPRATHIVWLDYSRGRVFAQVLRRTLWRGLTRAPLWSGNRESLRTAFFSRESILWWSLTTFDKNRRKYAALRADGAFSQARWRVFAQPLQARAWLHELPGRP